MTLDADLRARIVSARDAHAREKLQLAAEEETPPTEEAAAAPVPAPVLRDASRCGWCGKSKENGRDCREHRHLDRLYYG